MWFAKKDRLFTGNEVQVGDYCVGLYEPGFRSNGLSLTRKTFSTAYGENWHNIEFEGKKLGYWVLEPSIIYSACVSEMFGGFDREPRVELHGVSHITGGGIPGKIPAATRTVPPGIDSLHGGGANHCGFGWYRKSEPRAGTRGSGVPSGKLEPG